MIDKLRSIAIFTMVVDQGSFRAAAAHLGLAPSRISQAVSKLENELGVTLLYRSTRQLSLTNEGRTLHAKARQMLDAAEIGLDAISETSSEPTGTLRVTAPAFITQTTLTDTIAEFSKAYPRVSLDLDFSDRPRDLIKDGFDVSIRAGWLEDSEHRARRIGHADRLLVASPSYFKSKPPPRHPRELEDWNWIRFSIRPNHTDLTSDTGEFYTVTGKSNISVSSASALYEFALRGLGVTAIPENLAALGFQRGEIVRVLPNWSPRSLGLFAVWPSQIRRENLTVLFVRFLAGKASQEKGVWPAHT